LLDGGAKLDIFEGILSNNVARGGFGGHIRVIASRLNIHAISLGGLGVEYIKPMFPENHLLTGTKGTTTMTNGTALSGGAISCSSAKFPELGIRTESGTVIAFSSATGSRESEGGGGWLQHTATSS
jgi:hypothetical protein